MAFLVENYERKQTPPKINPPVRRSRYRYGIYKEYDESGFLNVKLKMHELEDPAIFINNRRRGEYIISEIASQYGLCLKYCHSGGPVKQCRCQGPCVGNSNADDYNLKVEDAISRYSYDHFNFLIVGEGRTPTERSLVCVENGKYIGYGFYDEKETQITNIEQAKDLIYPHDDHPEIRKIIRNFLKKRIKGMDVVAW